MKWLRFTLYIICSFISTLPLRAQLCRGSLGDPVVNITFGAGGNPGAPLNAATTNYTHANFDCPNDGSYAIRNSTSSCFGNSWHSLTRDHTGNANGYFMLVNASFQPSAFYLETVTGLCSNTTYEFAAWIMNVMIPNGSIQPNITFSIEKKDGTILKTYNSGDIPVTGSPQWKQYGFYFTTPANTSEVVLRMTNNAPGGIGNDLALDDITFRPCGPQVNITVNSFAKDTLQLCEGDETLYPFNSTISEGYNNPAYQWQLSTDKGATWTDIAGATKQNYNYSTTGNGTGTYLYRLSVSEGGNIGVSSCRIASKYITVIVNKKPELQLVADKEVCEGGLATLKATATFFEKETGLLKWIYPTTTGVSESSTKDDATKTITSTTVIQKATLSNGGMYIVSASSTHGCGVNDTSFLVVHKKPVAAFSTSSPLCVNNTVQFNDASNGNGYPLTNRYWKFGNGDSSIATNPTALYATYGNYNVTLVVKNEKGCNSDTLNKVLAVNPKPQVNFGLPKVCLSDPFAQFTDSSTIANGSQNSFTYLWSFGDPAANAANPNTSVQKNPKHTYTATGNYTVQLTVTSKDGCINDTTKVFTVNGAVPKAQFTFNGNAPFCSVADVALTNQSTVDFGTINKVEIFWDADVAATKATDADPTNGKQYTYNYDSRVGVPADTFNVKLVAYSGINCSNELTKTIIIQKSPQVQFDALPAVCEEVSPYQLIQASETTGSAGSGVFSGTGVTSGGTFNPRMARPGQHLLTYTFTTPAGCKDSAQSAIAVHPQPGVYAGEDKLVVVGGYVTLDGSATGNNLSYLWTPNVFLDNNKILRPKAAPDADILYTLTATTAFGCKKSDEVWVRISDDLYIPNAFTPNGDGINDTWRVSLLESFPGSEVWIYNRYGQVIFHTTESDVAWKGLYDGRPLPSGTYVYKIDLKNGKPIVSGTVTLIK